MMNELKLMNSSTDVKSTNLYFYDDVRFKICSFF